MADDLDGRAAGGGVHSQSLGGLFLKMEQGLERRIVGVEPLEGAGEEIEEFGEGSAGFGDEFDESDEIRGGEEAEIALLEAHAVLDD